MRSERRIRSRRTVVALRVVTALAACFAFVAVVAPLGMLHAVRADEARLSCPPGYRVEYHGPIEPAWCRDGGATTGPDVGPINLLRPWWSAALAVGVAGLLVGVGVAAVRRVGRPAVT